MLPASNDVKTVTMVIILLFIVTSCYPYNYDMWTKNINSFTEQVFRLTVVLLILYSIHIESTEVLNKCYNVKQSLTREVALRKRRERETDRRARETVEEREVRLSKRRAQDRKRASKFRASETAAQSKNTYSKLYTCNSSTHEHCIMTTYTCF